ncbi:hypothetical protein [Kitasatospora sp. NPDC002040]|uniref:hypothetical protein n=1 Tax=Kitasatospora sp. NPDC002040 TaxID=3154661 RepID=UPI0033199F5F
MTNKQQHETDVHLSIVGGTRLTGTAVHRRTVTAALIGGLHVDLTDVELPLDDELRITKLSLMGGVHLKVRPDVRVRVSGLRLGGVSDEGPSTAGGPTVRVSAWGLLGGVHVERA